MGRPPSRPKRLKDGFYIEVRNKGANAGMRIHHDDEESMKQAAAFYMRTGKDVLTLGEHKNDFWVNEDPNSERNRKSALARKSARDRRRRAKNKNEGYTPEKAAPKAETKKAEAKKPAKKAAAPKPKKETKAKKSVAKKATAKKPAKKKK